MNKNQVFTSIFLFFQWEVFLVFQILNNDKDDNENRHENAAH